MAKTNCRTEGSDNRRGGKRNGQNRNGSKCNSAARNGNRNSKQPFDQDKTDAPVSNNAAMYYTNAELASQLSSISFSNFLGFDESNEAFGKTDIPNVMTLYLNPSPGISNNAYKAGINIAAQKMYTYLSSNNAKTTIYAPQDLSMLILAFGEVLANIEVVKRALRVAYTYNIRNRALPLGVINAMGFNSDFVTSGKIAQLRLQLNTVINSFNQLPIPSNITYFEKVEGLYHTYYTDAEGPMVQYYVFTPYSTWVLDETTNAEGSELQTVAYDYDGANWKSYDRDISKFIDVINRQVQALLNSATLNSIYSDILRLSQNSSLPLRTVELLGVDEVIIPEYNPMRLLQIHNAYAIGAPKGKTNEHGLKTVNNNVVPYADNSIIEYLPEFTKRWLSDNQGFVLDFPHSMGDPDVDQRIDATRFVAFAGHRKSTGADIDPSKSTLSDHYVVMYRILGPGMDDKNAVTFYSILSYESAQASLAQIAACLAKFDYHPPVWIPCNNTAGTEYEVLCDYDFYTLIDRNYLIPVNQLANQGVFESRF